ncbi:MAG: transcriptional regulator, AraC family [Mucilaginibacter sp.]|nr:transcriptional regulator, AraC family [Mucilaginibacter sp.]
MNNKDLSLDIRTDKEVKDSFSVSYLEKLTYGEDQPVCRANYHRIYLIKEGPGRIQIDEREYPISGSELFILAKGQLYAFKRNTLISGYEICFGDCFWEKAPASANNCKAVLFNDATANQQVSITNTDLAELSLHFSALYSEFNKDDYINKPDALAAYLKIIMIKTANLNALLTSGNDSYENKLYRRFLDMVSSSYQTTHEVADFAQRLGISTRKLTDLCQKCGGKGAKELINGQLIAEAKRSLQFSSKPVKEIAYHLNFSTSEQFSHFFKKNTRLSPNQYRLNFAKIGM